MNPSQRKSEFIRQLAVYLVGDQARKSIELAMGNEAAQKWAELRNATPLFGYPTVSEAEEILSEFLR